MGDVHLKLKMGRRNSELALRCTHREKEQPYNISPKTMYGE